MRPCVKRLLYVATAMWALVGVCACVRADELVWATGRVVSAEGKPIKDAVVVAYNEAGKVVDYAQTDEKGEYALAIPEDVMRLERRKGGGFLARVAGTVKRFVTVKLDSVADTVKTGIRALTAAQAAAIPTPAAATTIAAGDRLANRVSSGIAPAKQESKKAEPVPPGSIGLRVEARGCTPFAGTASAYWVQEETSEEEGKPRRYYAAWLDPVQLTAVDSGKPSTCQSDYLKFTSARAEPSLVPPGQKFRITAAIPSPPDPAAKIVVIARSAETGQVWELKRGQDGSYSAEITADPKMPRKEQIISLLAYASESDEPARNDEAEKAIQSAGCWNPEKPYVHNPLLTASRNRFDLKITVLPDKS